jgi:2-polyprenyl-3-methyl-5-hydroxy-6-metoxy-1,4-benzoquinol methylase
MMYYSYDKAYTEGTMRTFDGAEERNAIFYFMDWSGLKVLEIGCGEGQLAAMMAAAGAEVTAVDTSAVAIESAVKKYKLPNLQFWHGEYKDVAAGGYDVVVMQGVMEHLDHPFEELNY